MTILYKETITRKLWKPNLLYLRVYFTIPKNIKEDASGWCVVFTNSIVVAERSRPACDCSQTTSEHTTGFTNSFARASSDLVLIQAKTYCDKVATPICYHSTFTSIKHIHKIPTGSLPSCGGTKYRWGIKISRFSTNKSLYLANDARYCHSYYGKRIGTRMRSIKWCHFQWPWTNPNPVFKVTSLWC